MLLTSALAVSYNGANTINSSATQSGKTYESATAGQNALLVTGGTSTVTNPTVTKSGSPSGSSDDYDFYGTNAAILVSGGTLTLSGGTVTTTTRRAISSGRRWARGAAAAPTAER